MAALLCLASVWVAMLTNVSSEFLPQQYDIILDIYDSLNGPSWQNCGQNISDNDCMYVLLKETTINNTLYQVVTGLYFDFRDEANAIGSIPDSIYNLTTLTQLEFQNAPYITGTISDRIANLANLKWLNLFNMSNLEGSLPSSLCTLTNLTRLILNDIGLTGKIPSCLFSNTSNLNILSFHNTQFSGSLPDPTATNSFSNLQQLIISDNAELTGTIPVVYLCAPSNLQISHNPKMSNNRVPDCWSDSSFTSNFTFVSLENSGFVGTFPSIYAPKLQYFFIGHNQFEGTVSQIIPYQHDGYASQLRVISMSNNKFTDPYIGELLQSLMALPQLEVLALYGNEGITGKLPDEWILDNHTEYLLLHGCDIHGTIPSSLEFTALKQLTLFDNRLSCTVPPQFIANCTESNCSALVISQNLLQCDKSGFPEWVDPYFKSAINLFVDEGKVTLSTVLLVICLCCLIVHWVYRIQRYELGRYTVGGRGRDPSAFMEELELFQAQFSHWRIWLVIVLLLALYLVVNLHGTEVYFECTPTITWFTLTWYHVHGAGYGAASLWILLMLSITMNVLLCNAVYRLYRIQQDKVEEAKQIGFRSSLQMQLLGKSLSQITEEPTFMDDEEEDMLEEVEYDAVAEQSMARKCVEWLELATYILVYLFGIAMTVLYLFCTSLPDDNVLVASKATREFIHHTVSLMLAMNNSVVVPNLMRKTGMKGMIRIKMVLVLRTINVLFVPVLVSLFILNDCGRWWTLYWTPCNEQNQHAFTVTLPEEGIFHQFNSELTLLTADDVCKPRGLSEIHMNKCIRSFFYNWTFVIMIKFMLMAIMPFLIMWAKIARQRLQRWWNERYLKQEDITVKAIEIDSEYVGILTAFESVMSFVIICPLILPVILAAIDANLVCYHLMVNKFKWRLTTYTNISQSFPVDLLVIGLLSGQLLTCLFFIAAIGNVVVYSLYVGAVAVVDVIYLVIVWKFKKNAAKRSRAFSP